MGEVRGNQAWLDRAAYRTIVIFRSRDVCAADLARRSVGGGARRNSIAPQGLTISGNDFRPPLAVSVEAIDGG